MNNEKIKDTVSRFLGKKNAAIITVISAFVVIIGGTIALAIALFGGSDEPEPSSSLSTTAETTSYDEIVELMDGYIEEYQSQKLLLVRAGECSVELSAAEADAPVDYDGLRDYLDGIGENSGIVADYRTVASAMNIPDPVLDTDYIRARLETLEDNLDPGGDGRYEVRRSSVVVYRGEPHLSFDVDAACEVVVSAFENNDYGEITLEVSQSEASAPDWDQLYEDFCYDPVNAEYSVDEAGNTVVVESSNGMDINIEEIKESYRTGDWDRKAFLGYTVYPEITTDNIDDGLFLDVLGSVTTTYLESEVSRATNVKLATQAIDDCIILPGFKFSFNNTVGERTAERGYQDALIYVSDGVEPGLGGGICQVSSTLYNATLLADLKQYSRECHMYTVFYVDLGMDATVSWGNIDYIFINNTKEPIKIEATAENGELTISILGTADYETREISFRNEIVETYGYQTLTTVDETLAPGTKNYQSTGRNGYRVETYKTVVKDGERYAEEWVSTSYYEPLDTIVTEGPPLETTARVTVTTKATTTKAPPPKTTEATKPPETKVPTGTTPPTEAAAARGGQRESTSEPPLLS